MKYAPKTFNNGKFSATGVYKLTCPECGKAYISQTGGKFSKRYNEHLRAIRNNYNSSKFTKNFRENMYTFGSMENIMQILNYKKSLAPENYVIFSYILDRLYCTFPIITLRDFRFSPRSR
jgi:hypothetical protein